MKNCKNDKGLLSIEASICLTIFIFLMLFMYSFLVVFEARNEMAHATLATADSLSYDPYRTESVEEDGIIGELIQDVFNATFPNTSPFFSKSKWYKKDSDNLYWNNNVYFEEGDADDKDYMDDYGKSAYVSTDFQQVLKERFFAYLAGSEDESKINEVLKRYHIVGGKDGISFKGSRIVDGDLYVVISYKLDYEFNVFSLLNITFEQSACSKLWK